MGLTLYWRSPARAALFVVGGVALDLDHLLLYAARSGDWSTAGALRYDRYRHRSPRPGDTRPRYGSLRSILHQPQLTLPLLWLASRAWPELRPLAGGVALHLALDLPFLMFDLRVWRRAGGRCERCGTIGAPRYVFWRRLPRHGGAWATLENRVVLCRLCAKEAFAGSEPPSLTPAAGDSTPGGESATG